VQLYTVLVMKLHGVLCIWPLESYQPPQHKLTRLTCSQRKINFFFFSCPRLLKTNQSRPIHCNKDASALDEGKEECQTTCIRFFEEGKRSSADSGRAFVFIEWPLWEVHPCLVTPFMMCFSQQWCSGSSGEGLMFSEAFPTDWRFWTWMIFPP